eukprot:COSAG03_NODE_1312_length_4349_cov_92.778563_4_plen_118_part_00
MQEGLHKLGVCAVVSDFCSGTEKLRFRCRKSCNLPPFYARFVRQSLPFLSIQCYFQKQAAQLFLFSEAQKKRTGRVPCQARAREAELFRAETPSQTDSGLQVKFTAPTHPGQPGHIV